MSTDPHEESRLSPEETRLLCPGSPNELDRQVDRTVWESESSEEGVSSTGRCTPSPLRTAPTHWDIAFSMPPMRGAGTQLRKHPGSLPPPVVGGGLKTRLALPRGGRCSLGRTPTPSATTAATPTSLAREGGARRRRRRRWRRSRRSLLRLLWLKDSME